MQAIFLHENLTKNFVPAITPKNYSTSFTKNLKSTRSQTIHCSKLMWIKTHTIVHKMMETFLFIIFN